MSGKRNKRYVICLWAKDENFTGAQRLLKQLEFRSSCLAAAQAEASAIFEEYKKGLTFSLNLHYKDDPKYQAMVEAEEKHE